MRGSPLDDSNSAVMKMRRQPVGMVNPPNVNGSAEAAVGVMLLFMMLLLMWLVLVKVSVGLREGNGTEDGVSVAPMQRDAHGGGESGGIGGGGQGAGGNTNDVASSQPLFTLLCFFPVRI